MIKSDRWIRRMAQEHGMIEPFAEGGVRPSTISFGLSSYGYDIRVADEFKIFTNVNSAIVDPKAFDPRSFVDVTAGSCLIPPNSFALARTVEYFRIPRNVLTVCLGKCVTGDTRVVDAETGDYRPIRAFVAERRPATLGLAGRRLTPAAVSAHLLNGVRPVFRLTTRMGLSLRATAAHPFLTPQGWRPLAELEPGDRVAAAAVCPVFGTGDWTEPEATLMGLVLSTGGAVRARRPHYRSADPALVEAFVDAGAALGCRAVPSGRDAWAFADTASGEATRTLPDAWLDVLAGVRPLRLGAPRAAFTAPRGPLAAFLRALFSSDVQVRTGGRDPILEWTTPFPRLARDIRHLLLRFGIAGRLRALSRGERGMAYAVQVVGLPALRRFLREIGMVRACAAERVLLDAAPEPRARARWHASAPIDAWRRAHPRARSSVALRVAEPSGGGVPEFVEDAARASLRRGTTDIEWDRVYAIHPAGMEEVYDLTVPDGHAFVANDLVVHNSTYARCGIILNVTPFEPEWEGYATLEISNTTPLPAKIYANEGIAQVLFFESDESCETSYGDKKGKYQAQRGIVLPRVL